jgi:hypothetical protein
LILDNAAPLYRGYRLSGDIMPDPGVVSFSRERGEKKG